MALENQYPLGKWDKKDTYSFENIEENIEIIASYPSKYMFLIEGLSDEDLSKTYREGAWNVRQLTVHISDMHILHYARFKQALCDENPDGFVANIDSWNSLVEVANANPEDAIRLLKATHNRWVHLMKSMKPADFDKTFHHPLRKIDLTLAQALDMAVWHTKQHLEHIRIALAE